MEGNKKLIYAEDLRQAIVEDKQVRGPTFAAVMRHLSAAPAVEARPVVHGAWEFGELDVLGQPVHCPVCGWGKDMVNKAMWLEYPGHQYCGNCGADMRGN